MVKNLWNDVELYSGTDTNGDDVRMTLTRQDKRPVYSNDVAPDVVVSVEEYESLLLFLSDTLTESVMNGNELNLTNMQYLGCDNEFYVFDNDKKIRIRVKKRGA